jgi:hypothetical protein
VQLSGLTEITMANHNLDLVVPYNLYTESAFPSWELDISDAKLYTLIESNQINHKDTLFCKLPYFLFYLWVKVLHIDIVHYFSKTWLTHKLFNY